MKELEEILAARTAAPFLFVGSGFSRRYLGLETWSELLKRFCQDVQEYGYYATSSNGNLPRAASLIAKDFNAAWWKLPKYEESRNQNRDQMKGEDSALKLEISNYLSAIDLKRVGAEMYEKEIDLLKGLYVDGIITTNWDLLLEELFPDYRVFIGQEQLLFANPQSIAEIYNTWLRF